MMLTPQNVHTIAAAILLALVVVAEVRFHRRDMKLRKDIHATHGQHHGS